MKQMWPVRLFSRSALKQTKFKQIVDLLGPTHQQHCLDIGSDNGVMSYLLRQQGGTWKSADLDKRSVAAIKELVKTEVYRIDGQRTPFQDNEFDCVVIVDFLEHIPDDVGFMDELYRILRPGGSLILNAPHIKHGLLINFREAIGLTEDSHGHLRPGYSLDSVTNLLGDCFTLEVFKTYTKFFSKLVDTLMVYAISQLKKNKREKTSGRGILVTGKDLNEYKRMFRVYSLIYPIVWFISKLDHLLFFRSGYMLIAKARVIKETARHEASSSWRAEDPVSAQV